MAVLKETFVRSVQSHIPQQELQRISAAPLTSDARLTTVCLHVIVWAAKYDIPEYAHAAEELFKCYQDQQFTDQENLVLLAHGVEQLLGFIWEATQQNSDLVAHFHTTLIGLYIEMFTPEVYYVTVTIVSLGKPIPMSMQRIVGTFADAEQWIQQTYGSDIIVKAEIESPNNHLPFGGNNATSHG